MQLTKIILPVLLLLSTAVFSQDDPADSLKTLEEVTIRAFEQNRKASTSTANISLVAGRNADLGSKTSLVHSFNTIAGVRMEERSPASYRINIRGSSLRSPFGVRNVKVYWNGLPVTDPGGNTYFSMFAINNFSTIELFKGPAGSLYGAGTGGLILMHTNTNRVPGISLDYSAGNYGLQNVMLDASFGKNGSGHQLTFAYNKSDGYRAQSAMRRANLSWTSGVNYGEERELKASFIFTDLEYETPGALTPAEFANNPRAARPAAGPFPGAEEIDAAIFQKTILAGLSNQYRINHAWKNSTSIYGAFAQLKNSAVRNYERRIEPHFGGRTSMVFNTKMNNTDLQLVAGGEFQQGYFNTQVADNVNGSPDTIQTNDDVSLTTLALFLQADLSIAERWYITAGASLNDSRVSFRRLSEYPVLTQEGNYRNEIAPRLSVLGRLTKDLSLLATVSKGFSPPTVAELLPSTGIISTDLEAEKGMNYELTARYNLRKARIYFAATGFYFRLHDALVQRHDAGGADFFVNAGEISQKGIELHARHTTSFKAGSLIDHLMARVDYTYNHFRYGEFVKGDDDFTGNEVPSVPSNTISILTDLVMKNGIYLTLNFYSASAIYLNDANTAKAEPYKILGGRLGWRRDWNDKYRLNLYVGGENLFDELYSLGNDINAAGNRYYNAAPGRSLYAGVSIGIN